MHGHEIHWSGIRDKGGKGKKSHKAGDKMPISTIYLNGNGKIFGILALNKFCA